MIMEVIGFVCLWICIWRYEIVKQFVEWQDKGNMVWRVRGGWDNQAKKPGNTKWCQPIFFWSQCISASSIDIPWSTESSVLDTSYIFSLGKNNFVGNSSIGSQEDSILYLWRWRGWRILAMYTRVHGNQIGCKIQIQ